jgi:hypothetical protein
MLSVLASAARRLAPAAEAGRFPLNILHISLTDEAFPGVFL